MTIYRFDLYRVPQGDLHVLAGQVEAALNTRFELHESGYVGGDYFLAHSGPVELKVVPNYLDEEGYRLENNCETTDLLLYVHGPPDDVRPIVAKLSRPWELVSSDVIEARSRSGDIGER